MKSWKSEILQEVDVVSFRDCLPGVIVVYGEKAQPVLANKKGEVLCAVAEFGQGRIVIFSHDMFVTSFNGKELKHNKQFNQNIRKWLTRGTDQGKEILAFNDFIHNLDALPSECQMLSWNGFGNPHDHHISKLIEWIERGGGLICGVCPWGFVQLTGIDVSIMPLNLVFQKVGVAYTGEQIYTNDTDGIDEINVENNMADYVKPQDLCAEINEHPEKIDQLGGLVNGILHLPDEMYVAHNHVLREVIDKMCHENDKIPTRTKPVNSSAAKKAACLMGDMMLRDGLSGQSVCADGIDCFPGNFQSTPVLESIEVSITSTCFKYHATGCYLPAGTVMEISWIKTKKPWKLFVGMHGDDLTNNGEGLRRWPKVTLKKDLESHKYGDNACSPVKICSPFGGLVYVESPSDCIDKLELRLNNVVPAPMFTYSTARMWESVERYKPGLWCDVIGDKISITLPSASVRHLPDLTSTMKAWDSVVIAHTDLRGMDPSNCRGQWVVTDEQPSAGYMHSGYPIVTHLDVSDPNKKYSDCFLLDRDNIVNVRNGNGCWGMFHELGHNFQDNLWTWDATVEVTCNIFTLHAMDVICGVKPWDHPWLRDQLEKASNFLREGAMYDTWCSDPAIALAVYAQLARDFGWNAYKSVFRIYNTLPQDKYPNTRDEKEDMWIETFSNTVKRNLCPVYEYWGWPVRNCVQERVGHYPFYLPDDETTNSCAKERASAIIRKYSL